MGNSRGILSSSSSWRWRGEQEWGNGQNAGKKGQEIQERAEAELWEAGSEGWHLLVTAAGFWPQLWAEAGKKIPPLGLRARML